MPKIAKILLIAVVSLALATTAGVYGYIHFINDDTPERLTFNSTTTTAATPGVTTAPTDLDGTWSATSASQVGYRVKETLFGQSTEAVGRTNSVTGTLTYSNSTVSDANFSADMRTVKSDQGNRDNQFRTRIMDAATFPTATFKLTKPITLAEAPSSSPQTVLATGDLTLRGSTQSVTTELQIRQNGSAIEAAGNIPITFSNWNIPNPSFGPAETEDNGELELLIVFNKSVRGLVTPE